MENKDFIECECGVKVYGNSKEHAESLLPAHKTSKIHSERMEAIKFSEKQK